MQTLKLIVRRLAQTPGFTAVVLLTLAIGVGANSAIFSVVNGVLIKPLPFHQPDSLVSMWHLSPGVAGIPKLNASPTMYFTYRDQNQTFQEFGVWNGGGASVTGLAEPEQVLTVNVTYGTLQALGVQPAVGRLFTPADDAPGAPETMILTYGYWQRRFGGESSAVGRMVTVNAKPRMIIGVMPRSFQFLNVTADLILPQQFDRNKIFLGNFSYQGIVRLKPGVSIPQANADIARMLPIWLKSWPAPPGFDAKLFENARLAPVLTPLKQDVIGDIGKSLWVLMGTIGMVLLIACANVANLLLVRAEGRQQELAIRAALGAGWSRIARELLTESLVLGLLGGALGLGLAYAGVRLLVSVGPQTLPRLNEIGIDPWVLAFTLVISVFAGLLFGLVPVVKYAGPKLAASLRAGGRTLSQSRERHRARNTLVVVQVALALVLLIGSGLMIRTFQALKNVQPGFQHPASVQSVRLTIPAAQIEEPERVLRMENDLLEKISAISGVTAAAAGTSAPLDGFNSNDLLFARDKTYGVGEIPPVRRFKSITPGYFNALGIPLIAGRDLTWTDLYDRRQVLLISENMARELWGGAAAALGKQVRVGAKDPWREIVGVVGDVYDNGVQQPPPTTAYWPVLMDTFEGSPHQISRSLNYVIHTSRAGTESFLDELHKAIWSVNPNLPLSRVRTLQDYYQQSMARTSFTLVMLAIAGAMALLLGIVGIYGVISYAVSQRAREIGIRMALGAENGELTRMFVRHGLLLAVVGVPFGVAAAVALTRLMSSLLFHISPLDPLTYAAVSGALVLVAVAASYVPARRVAAVDPVEALRSE